MLGKISREKDSFQKLVRRRVSQETHENFGRAKTPCKAKFQGQFLKSVGQRVSRKPVRILVRQNL